eukprot:6184100-Pleurochrysis_carterae.AAC.1
MLLCVCVSTGSRALPRDCGIALCARAHALMQGAHALMQGAHVRVQCEARLQTACETQQTCEVTLQKLQNRHVRVRRCMCDAAAVLFSGNPGE